MQLWHLVLKFCSCTGRSGKWSFVSLDAPPWFELWLFLACIWESTRGKSSQWQQVRAPHTSVLPVTWERSLQMPKSHWHKVFLIQLCKSSSRFCWELVQGKRCHCGCSLSPTLGCWVGFSVQRRLGAYWGVVSSPLLQSVQSKYPCEVPVSSTWRRYLRIWNPLCLCWCDWESENKIIPPKQLPNKQL